MPFNGQNTPEVIYGEHEQACIDLLEEALAEARRGNVHGMALVLCMEGGWASNMAGTRPGDLNLGCDDLKRKILDAVTGADLSKQVRPGAKSSILRVR